MIAVADSPNPPVHLILGKIALTRFRDKLAQWQSNISEWQSVTLGSDFPQ